MVSNFTGFNRNGISFLREISLNNNKEWFHAHKQDFEEYLLIPAKNFVSEMLFEFKSISQTLNGETVVGKSISRMNRDIRFSRDKRPYKNYVEIWFWEGTEKSWERSGFIMRLSAEQIMFGAGILEFSKPLLLEKYRSGVADSIKGNHLSNILSDLKTESGGNYYGSTYKKIPKGYTIADDKANLLLHSGLYADITENISDVLFSEDFIPYSIERYKKLAPLHLWILELVRG